MSKDSGIINDYPSNTSLTSLCKLIESSIDSSTGGTFFNAFLCQKILVEIMTIFIILLYHLYVSYQTCLSCDILAETAALA